MLVDAGADLAAVAAVQAGERAAFAQLVRRHQRRAYNVCRAILVTHEDAEDAEDAEDDASTGTPGTAPRLAGS